MRKPLRNSFSFNDIILVIQLEVGRNMLGWYNKYISYELLWNAKQLSGGIWTQ